MARLFDSWRIWLVVGALLIGIGGPMHPGGTMEQMLANPQWVPGHSLVLAGFIALLIALVSFQRTTSPGASRTRAWLRLAIVATTLQAIEMALHTAAALDYANLVAGRRTPVLTTHLTISVVIYPLFAVALIGLMIAGSRDRSLGRWWLAPIGIVGLIGHGLAAPLVVAFGVPGARVLFPLLMLFALWMLAAGIAGRAAA